MATNGPVKRILVVDDDHAIREMIVRYLRQTYGAQGWEIDAVGDGEQAVTSVRFKRPAIVLLDYAMPGMSGLDTLRLIHKVDARIPVIVITASDSTRVASEVIQAGAFSYLPKPIRFPYLDHLLATALGSKA
ncbi:MAG TPA: response regulator [Candidatus Tectomicrobia bacterium]|nr:response regulator [Candidatus Tectomicrobia bacterium]